MLCFVSNAHVSFLCLTRRARRNVWWRDGDKVFPKPLQRKGGTPRLPTHTSLPLSLSRFYSKLPVVLYLWLLSQFWATKVAVVFLIRVWSSWTLSTILTNPFFARVITGGSGMPICGTRHQIWKPPRKIFCWPQVHIKYWSLRSIFWIHHQKQSDRLPVNKDHHHHRLWWFITPLGCEGEVSRRAETCPDWSRPCTPRSFPVYCTMSCSA